MTNFKRGVAVVKEVKSFLITDIDEGFISPLDQCTCSVTEPEFCIEGAWFEWGQRFAGGKLSLLDILTLWIQ